MRLTIRNETCYPDADVRALIRFAVEPLDLPHTVVLVNHTRQSELRRANNALSPYSGRAFYGMPERMRRISRTAKRAIRLSVGQPECFPMSRFSWRNGWDYAPGQWPLFRHRDWREALVHIAAHEGKHTEYQAERKAASELACELYAQRRLDEYLAAREVADYLAMVAA